MQFYFSVLFAVAFIATVQSFCPNIEMQKVSDAKNCLVVSNLRFTAISSLGLTVIYFTVSLQLF